MQKKTTFIGVSIEKMRKIEKCLYMRSKQKEDVKKRQENVIMIIIIEIVPTIARQHQNGALQMTILVMRLS